MSDGSIDHITAHEDGHENANAALVAVIPEGTKLIAVRTDS
jgi:hypothetical protein